MPAGIIAVREPIVLHRDRQVLRGSGSKTILWLADGANCPVIILGEPVNCPSTVVTRLAVSDLSIDGNRLRQTRELWRLQGDGTEIRNNGITAQGVENSAVESVTITRCRSGGLVTSRKVRHLIVRGLESSENEYDGLACYETEDSVFANLSLHDNLGAGLSLDWMFNHNCVRNARLVNNDLGIFMRASHNNEFIDVAVIRSHHYGVFMADAAQSPANRLDSASAFGCTHNMFDDLVVSECGGAAFRVNDVTCTDNVIRQPTFAGNLQGNLSLPRGELVTILSPKPESPFGPFLGPLSYRTVPSPMRIAESLCASVQQGLEQF